MSLRIKGQEVSVTVSAGGVLIAEFTDITQFDGTEKFRKLEQGYLGQTTNQHDDIYDGFDGNMTMHMFKDAFHDFEQRVKDRAKRITPDLVVNITATFVYPDAPVRRKFLPDVKFGPMNMTASARGDYVAVKLDFSCDDTRDIS